MTSTLNPACPLCGLRYENRPLLDLHIREDHRQQAGHRGAACTGASRPAASSASPASGLASRPSRTGGQVITLAGQALRALRHVNDEFLLASEAIIRSARAPADPRPGVTDRADRAA